MVKNTFVACGVPDDPTLDTVAKQLIQLYSTLQGWEVIPGKLNEPLLINYQKTKSISIRSKHAA